MRRPCYGRLPRPGCGRRPRPSRGSPAPCRRGGPSAGRTAAAVASALAIAEHTRILQRLAGLVADILEDLRHGSKRWQTSDTGSSQLPGPPRAPAAPRQIRRRSWYNPTECMTPGLAADIVAVGPHRTRAHSGRPLRRTSPIPSTVEIAFKPEVATSPSAQRRRAWRAAVLLPTLRDHREQLVAIDDIAARRPDHRGRRRHRARCRCRRASRGPSGSAAIGGAEPNSLMLNPSGSTPIGITSAPAPRAYWRDLAVRRAIGEDR